MSEPRTFEIPEDLANQFDDLMAEEGGLASAMEALTKQFGQARRHANKLWAQAWALHPDLPDGARYNSRQRKIVLEGNYTLAPAKEEK